MSKSPATLLATTILYHWLYRLELESQLRNGPHKDSLILLSPISFRSPYGFRSVTLASSICRDWSEKEKIVVDKSNRNEGHILISDMDMFKYLIIVFEQNNPVLPEKEYLQEFMTDRREVLLVDADFILKHHHNPDLIPDFIECYKPLIY